MPALVAHATGLPIRTATRWAAQHRCCGLAGLARRGRADCGKRRTLSAALLRFVEGLALQKPPLSVAAIYREASRLATARDEPLPSYHSVYRATKALPLALQPVCSAVSKAGSISSSCTRISISPRREDSLVRPPRRLLPLVRDG
jgi:hypothetical protein